MTKATEIENNLLKTLFKDHDETNIIILLKEYEFESHKIERAILSTASWCTLSLLNSFLNIPNFNINFKNSQFLTCSARQNNVSIVKYLIENELADPTEREFRALIDCFRLNITEILPILLTNSENLNFITSGDIFTFEIFDEKQTNLINKFKHTFLMKKKITEF
jgi:hypothetical protein